MRAILIADVVGSVRLMEQDEDDTIRRWREFIDVVVHCVLPQHRGRMVKSLGDGMLLEFESVSDCVQSAVSLLAWLQRSNAALPLDRQIRLRIGIHLADVVLDDVDVFGDGVNLAARLASLGGAQEIIVSAAVRDQLSDRSELDFEDLGERKLKNLQRLVRAFRVSSSDPDQAPNGHESGAAVAGQRCAALPSVQKVISAGSIGASIRQALMGALSGCADLGILVRLLAAMSFK